jgi:hypothetical protein
MPSAGLSLRVLVHLKVGNHGRLFGSLVRAHVATGSSRDRVLRQETTAELAEQITEMEDLAGGR